MKPQALCLIGRITEKEARVLVFSEFFELVNVSKKGRINNKEITLYDSVGIALEDYSALRLTYELAKKYNIGEERNLTPILKNPKNLISLINIKK